MDLLAQAKAKSKPIEEKQDEKPKTPETKSSSMMAPAKSKQTIDKPKIVKSKKPKMPNIICILWGYDGTSKSEQIMKFNPAPLIIDLENKLEPLAVKLGFPVENIVVASKYNEKYDISGGDTLKAIRAMLTNIRKKLQNGDDSIKAIGLDGISDIRPYAVAEWLEENPSRKSPVNAGDWSDINDKVRDIVIKLINIGRAEGISIFLTAQVGGEYLNGEKVKETPDCKPWISHNVDHKFRLTRDDDNQKFLAYCEKSYWDPFFTIDLTDFKHDEIPSLLNMLQDKETLNEYKNKYVQERKESIKTRSMGV